MLISSHLVLFQIHFPNLTKLHLLVLCGQEYALFSVPLNCSSRPHTYRSVRNEMWSAGLYLCIYIQLHQRRRFCLAMMGRFVAMQHARAPRHAIYIRQYFTILPPNCNSRRRGAYYYCALFGVELQSFAFSRVALFVRRVCALFVFLLLINVLKFERNSFNSKIQIYERY